MKQIFVKCIKRPEGRKIRSELILMTDILTDGQNNLFSSYQQDYIRWLDIAYRFFSKIRHKLDRLRPHGRGQQRGGEQRGVALLLDHRHHRLSRLPPHHARRRIRVCNMYILICVLLYIDNDVSHLWRQVLLTSGTYDVNMLLLPGTSNFRNTIRGSTSKVEKKFREDVKLLLQ